MENFQERVITEEAELQAKADKLLGFFKTGESKGLPYVEQKLLVDQHKIMCEYIDLLRCRISLF